MGYRFEPKRRTNCKNRKSHKRREVTKKLMVERGAVVLRNRFKNIDRTNDA
jgi:hypothetical protein